MPTRGICNARCQAFHVEMVQKEESLRIKWFLTNQQKLLDHLKTTQTQKITEPPTVKQSNAGIISPKPMPNWRPMKPDGSINMDIMKPIDPRVRALLYHDAPSFINAENYCHESHPNNSSTIKGDKDASYKSCKIIGCWVVILYFLTTKQTCRGDTKVNFAFLCGVIWSFIFKDIPEDRYFFPDCTSWVYGWRLSDYSPVPRSKVGQTNVMIREFFHPRLSSLQRDPEWYRPSKYTLSVCVDNAN